MKRFLLGVAIACSMAALFATPSFADNFSGKIDLVQVTSAGTRFLISSKKLSLFASGEYRDVLLQGFYRKATMDIGYRATACTGGITGACGNVNFVSVNTTGF